MIFSVERIKKSPVLILPLAWLLAFGCASAWAQSSGVMLQTVVTGLSSPVFLTSARDGTNRKFILEQPGRILVMQPGLGSSANFLDIRERVLSGGEQGLLGLAFHPQFSSNGRFFVNYTRRPDGATVISEFRASPNDPNSADADSETIFLEIPQPFPNHNGGMIAFGPDNYLYIGMGDGGSGNDPNNYAQNNDELLGKILRIDVDHAANEATRYSSPASNPFFGPTPGRDEIYATGFRNPWRFSFDRATGKLYVGDVGQNAIEEIDLVTRGANYGWRIVEGSRCTGLDPASCASPALTGPIAEYDHSGGRCSVTGGYVYRGTQLSLPYGAYVFADFCSGEIFMIESGIKTLALATNFNISSFGEDESGELYVVEFGGSVRRLTRSGPPGTPVALFLAPERGGATLASTASGAALKSGYARLQGASGAAPAALAIYGLRQEGVLVSEASASAVPLISSGRILATTGIATKTGIAIVNPDETAVTVVFHFTDAAGQNFALSSYTIRAHGQISRFLHEAPFNGGASLDGTFTFWAARPVAVTALTLSVNSRGAPLLSMLPIATPFNLATAPTMFPHWTQGGGWSTEFALVNLSDQYIAGAVELRFPDGQLRECLYYSIPPRSSRRIASTAIESEIHSGSGKLIPSTGPPPAGLAIFRFSPDGVTITETAVPAMAAGNAFLGFGEILPGRRTGLAVANMSPSSATVTIELTTIEGSGPALTGVITLPPSGQRGLFLDEVPGLESAAPFVGTIRIFSTAPIAVTGLRTRINERGDFLITASVPIEESTFPSQPELFFPHIAVGGAYQMEFVLLNTQRAGNSSGRLIFYASDGSLLPVNIQPVAIP